MLLQEDGLFEVLVRLDTALQQRLMYISERVWVEVSYHIARHRVFIEAIS